MNKTIKIILIILFIFIGISLFSTVNAASASIKASKTTVNVGETVTVTVTINAAAWEVSVNGSGIKSDKYVDVTNDGNNATTTKTLTLDTATEGEKTVNISGNVSDGETGKTTNISDSVKITVKKVETNSGETTGNSNNNNVNTSTNENANSGTSNSKDSEEKATLRTLKINGSKVDINGSFNVENATSIDITPTTSNAESCTVTNVRTNKSTTVYSGNSKTIKLEEGTNKLNIKLKSGNTYSITINNKTVEETQPNIIDETDEKEEPKEEKLLLKSLTVENFSLTPEFSQEVYAYNIDLTKEQKDITSLVVKAVANKEDATVEITGNENIVEGENIVTIIVKSSDGKNIVTYQIIVNKPQVEEQAVLTSANVEIPQEVSQEIWGSTQKVLIAVFTAIIAIAGIVFAVIEYRYRKNKETEIQIPYSHIEFGKEDIKNDEANIEIEQKENKQECININNEELEEMIDIVDVKKEKIKNKGKHF